MNNEHDVAGLIGTHFWYDGDLSEGHASIEAQRFVRDMLPVGTQIATIPDPGRVGRGCDKIDACHLNSNEDTISTLRTWFVVAPRSYSPGYEDT